MSLQEIQKRASALSEHRDRLSALFLTLQSNLDTVKNGSLADIKRVARQVAKEHNELVDHIKAHPELFEKPRTYVVDGIKFGMLLSNGSLQWDDDEKVCDRIRRLVDAGEITAEQADLLIKTTEKPVASALAQLDAKVLKRLGVSVEGAGDQPLIKSVDSTIEKAVTSVINAAIKEANAELS
ncbi:hypothetical protein [Acidovorax sp. BLS4]|uniref:hypothetical protein n=1 Tax=Acidovorax sp. BLS4 TaxID=3273430 RepID=UPI0029430DF3|nr:hypothetical protein [Paracidovorax avenae]WOI47004.1 hypothetical protein R1Z03_07265 [Paracidovorax avenae]